jgi:transposase InsO family protein
MCHALSISVSGFFSWCRGGKARKRLTDMQLLTLIKALPAEIKGAYGWPRIWQELKARGIPAGKERIRKRMQAHGVRGRHKRRYKATTDSRHAFPVAPNLLNRQFRPDRPGKAWVTDITKPLRNP